MSQSHNRGASHRVHEVYACHTFRGTSEDVLTVFEDLPRIMQDVVVAAAETPASWVSYENAELRAGLKPRQFARSFGGYRSKDPDRPRPFHLGRDQRGRWHLLVDHQQAAALSAL